MDGLAPPQRSGPTCDVDISDLTIKTIRLVIHVFQKDDGTGNLQDNSYDKYWLGLFVSDASNKMASLDPMNLSTTSPYFQDSKIRYQLMDIYFWQSTAMWSKGNNTSSNRNALQNYIDGQTISYANTAMHIFIPGNYGNDGFKSSGIACGFGCKKNLLMEDVFYDYNNGGNFWVPAGTLRHEVGHNLNLFHSWLSDQCDDTPTHSNCFNSNAGCSNNIMDENNSLKAMTLDQLSRCHVWLNNNDEILISGKENRTLNGSVSTSSGTSSLSCCTSSIDATSAQIDITSPSNTTINWTKTGGSGNFSSSNNGQTVNLFSMGDIYLKAEWEENCMSFEKTYVFFYLPQYRYSANPNPTQNVVTVYAESNKGYSSINGTVSEYSTEIETLQISDLSGNILKVFQFQGSQFSETIDISDLKDGQYLIRIKNEMQTEVIKVLKI